MFRHQNSYSDAVLGHYVNFYPKHLRKSINTSVDWPFPWGCDFRPKKVLL